MNKQHPIILFDGICNLCSAAVLFIIQRDRKARFRFGSLQSAEAAALLQDHAALHPLPDSILLLDHQGLHSRSTAALRIARSMDGAWPLLFGLIVVPRIVRDPLYNWIARNRYRWFGKKESCMIPTPELRERFLS